MIDSVSSKITQTGPKQKIRILLVGCGLGGRKHLELLAYSTRSILAAVVAPLRDSNLACASEMNVPLFASMEEALDRVEIDAAIIASPNNFHAEQTMLCINKGVPVLVEKPLTTDLWSAAAICRESKTRNVPVLVGHHRAYNPLLLAAKEFMNSEKFGEFVAMQGSALFRKPEHYFKEGPWRTRIGGGPILINLIHEIGVIRFLCGPISAVSVLASNARRRFDVEDTAAISIRFNNGALGTFVLSDIAASNRSWELATGENPAYPHSSDATCYHFAGTKGSLDFPTLQARFYESNDTASWWNPFMTEVLSSTPFDPLKRQLAHFEDVVTKKTEPLVPATIGFENMQVLEAIQQAILTGETINLDNDAVDQRI
ncbi:Gfo/Idh/MocA family protein [Acidithiobacillus sulfurivorans]|uniref:Gfo/Idh/MocA family oxidoreductase n=1 Tax=Acidithiobacillus sulfurivorans TaxID=1958756 RepID=A0ABS5ZV71_9PROT|nr:Gfo/Idh/MocA family oxidoreductase [Acidithiobacillus sulfurivorans]MBU2759070.1 Gfo/Idh/MocA family oxidoreductase [Acidithiobacillus sulfurivorans]